MSSNRHSNRARKKSWFKGATLVACVAASLSCQQTRAVYSEPIILGRLEVGVAAVDITPKDAVGVDLSGYGSRSSTGVHDPVTARCLVVNDVAFIALDHSNLPYSEVTRVAPMLEQASGIAEDRIFIHVTHSHSGPSLDYYHGHPTEHQELIGRISDCLVSAKEGRREASAVYGRGLAAVDTINREHPDKEVPKVVHAIEFRDAESRVVAVLANFACHPVVLGPDNLLISSDYPHYLRQRLQEAKGATAVFFSGSLGDINPPPVNGSGIWDRTGGTFEMAQGLGYGIADGALSALGSPEPLPIDVIRIASKELQLPDGPTGRSTKISMVALGYLWIVTVPGEPFSSFQQRLEQSLPSTTTLFFGLTHDRVGYIVPENEWDAFRLHSPGEAPEGSESWAALLEAEYALLAEKIAP